MANCLQEHHACRLYVLGFLFSSSLPSFTYLPAPEVGPANQGLKCGPEERGCQDGVGMEDAAWERGRQGRHPHRRPTGELGSASGGRQSRRGRRGGGEGGKYTGSKATVEGER